MSEIRLYLDEDVWEGLAALRESGFDVMHTYEVGRGGASDPEQLSYASQEKRAIFTHNSKDFVPLAVDWFFDERHYSGIIISPQIEKGGLLKRLKKLMNSISAEEISNTVRHLSDYK